MAMKDEYKKDFQFENEKYFLDEDYDKPSDKLFELDKVKDQALKLSYKNVSACCCENRAPKFVKD